MRASVSTPFCCEAGSASRRTASRLKRHHAHCVAGGDGSGRPPGDGSGAGGGGGGSEGAGSGWSLGVPLPLLYVSAWALGTEALAVLQYRDAAARDAQRRVELFSEPGPTVPGAVTQNAGAATAAAVPTVSIIVPVLNEEAGIEEALTYLQLGLQPAAAEIIVVDGGSTDRTVQLARRCGARVMRAGRGRARQMNAGAAAARGELLLFAHADTRPPRGVVAEVAKALARPGIVLGGFRPVIGAVQAAAPAAPVAHAELPAIDAPPDLPQSSVPGPPPPWPQSTRAAHCASSPPTTP